MFRIFSNFQNFQTLFRISSTKTGLFRISWLCSDDIVELFLFAMDTGCFYSRELNDFVL
jgi:hypothetical protein